MDLRKSERLGTYELLGLTAVLDLNEGLATLVDDLEGEVLHIGLDLSVLELATDETLRVEDGVVWVHRDLVLGGIADQPLVVREGNIRGCCPVTLVVGNDFDTVVLPYTNTAEGKGGMLKFHVEDAYSEKRD